MGLGKAGLNCEVVLILGGLNRAFYCVGAQMEVVHNQSFEGQSPKNAENKKIMYVNFQKRFFSKQYYIENLKSLKE